MPTDVRDPRVQKGILAAIGVAGLLSCYFLTDWVPFTYKANASQIQELENSYREMSKDLNKARQATHSLPYLEKEYELLHRKWEQSESLLPEDQDMAWLLRTVTLLGTNAGVQFTLFHPLPAKPSQHHTENPIEIKVRGSYHQVGSFLGELANLERIVNVSDLEMIVPKDKDEEETCEAYFVASTYVLGGTGVPPEPPETKAAKGKKPAAKGNGGKDSPKEKKARSQESRRGGSNE